MVVEEDGRTVLIGQCELHGVLGPRIELLGCVEELKRHKPAVFIDRGRLYDRSIDGPDRTRDEKAVDRIRADGFDGGIDSAAGSATDLDAGDSPAFGNGRLFRGKGE